MLSTLDSFLATPVQAFVRGDVPSVRLNTDIKTLGEIYRSSPLNCILVVNKEGRLAGLLDDNAISRISELSDPSTATAFDLLKLDSSPLAAVKWDAPMWEAMKVMNGESQFNGARRVDILPVITPDSSPVGVISRADLALKSVATGSAFPPVSGQFAVANAKT